MHLLAFCLVTAHYSKYRKGNTVHNVSLSVNYINVITLLNNNIRYTPNEAKSKTKGD